MKIRKNQDNTYTIFDMIGPVGANQTNLSDALNVARKVGLEHAVTFQLGYGNHTVNCDLTIVNNSNVEVFHTTMIVNVEILTNSSKVSHLVPLTGF